MQQSQIAFEKLHDAYRLMKTIREFEERMRSEYQQGKLPGFIHIYRNQEAVAVAACLDMTNEGLHCEYASGAWPLYCERL
jgi:pyruvate dehydrogenase E1 component alpha subunit